MGTDPIFLLAFFQTLFTLRTDGMYVFCKVMKCNTQSEFLFAPVVSVKPLVVKLIKIVISPANRKNSKEFKSTLMVAITAV